MKKKTLIIIVIIVLVLVLGLIFFFRNRGSELIVNTATIGEETISITVTATGYVQPVDQVEVGTQVSGVVEKIYVDYNSQVTKGQLLAELDKSTLSEKVTQANASLLSSQSALTLAQQSYNRTKQLYDLKAATTASFEDAVNQLNQAQTSVANAEANLHQAQVNLSYAEIYSPIDGVVLSRAVEQGQTVAASFNTPTLFTIANDLKNMQVEADVDEADIGQVKLGQQVTFTVDAFPYDTFEGEVKQIRLEAVVTSNVVTYTVIINAPNPDEKLYPGMTANVTILTQTEEGIAVPNSALNFSPDDQAFQKLHFTAPQTPVVSRHGEGGVWMETSGGYQYNPVTTGISDGVYTMVKSGLNINDKVVVSVAEMDKNEASGAAANPLMPTPPRRR
ncbi:MAG: efflux RND transporter periplasmic adaptor subunit [Bacteroidales bacterium]|nr:efflux RND transporter periplasmic adaptor subunit [Bacteroidales bacterium]